MVEHADYTSTPAVGAGETEISNAFFSGGSQVIEFNTSTPTTGAKSFASLASPAHNLRSGASHLPPGDKAEAPAPTVAPATVVAVATAIATADAMNLMSPADVTTAY